MGKSMRDVRKYLREYKELYYNKRGNPASFNLSDLSQIIEIATERQNDLQSVVIRAAINAAEFGFMVGYKKAVNDRKRKYNPSNKTSQES